LPRSLARRKILLTGASGVVGEALLPRLLALGADVVCLTHRSLVAQPGVESVVGDLTRPRFGLTPHEFRSLGRRVDVVVHSAAVTDFNREDGSLEATNVLGVRHVLDFVATAEACLYHLSTAFVDTHAVGERGRTAVRYATSKREGEALVRNSALPHVILRPSIVIGDSMTGQISAFQGIYLVAGALLRGTIPMIPFDPGWPVDFIPRDVLADAITAVIRAGLTAGEFWLTAGSDALSLEQAVAVVLRVAEETGIPPVPPRFIPPDLFDRLVAPVFFEALPERLRTRLMRLLDFFAVYLARDKQLPTSLPQLRGLGVGLLPEPAQSLHRSLRYWVDVTHPTAATDREKVA
jgi:nucleoside-diphosphate-sugar epimerase